MALIEVENLEKVYAEGETKTRALNGVSLAIGEGEFAAIMGPSGSGKSTLLHFLGFLDRPSAGRYSFDGRIMDEYADDELARIRNRKMGFVFQTFNLMARTSLLENVKLPLLYSQTDAASWEELAMSAVKAVGLEERIHHEPSQLSGGERQRVAIARALVNNPTVIFADEPTGNLDSKAGGRIMEEIEKLNRRGHTIVLVTHETYTAEYAERIIKLKDGRIESDERVKVRRNANDNQFLK